MLQPCRLTDRRTNRYSCNSTCSAAVQDVLLASTHDGLAWLALHENYIFREYQRDGLIPIKRFCELQMYLRIGGRSRSFAALRLFSVYAIGIRVQMNTYFKYLTFVPITIMENKEIRLFVLNFKFLLNIIQDTGERSPRSCIAYLL